jgi:hypothetical protein
MLNELPSPIYKHNDAFAYSFSLNARFKIMCFTFSDNTDIHAEKLNEGTVSFMYIL